jgi:hypothetical protein
MRFIVSVCAVVFVLSLVGSFFAGYKVGSLEGAQTAWRGSQGPEADVAAARNFFGANGEQGAAQSSPPAEGDSQPISGKITLGKDVAKKLKNFAFAKDDALFVIATKPELGPQPLAVIRLGDLVGKSFPIPYQIGPEDLMIQDRGAFSGPLTIKVKLSHTGDAKTSEGDLLGSQKHPGEVAPGSGNVDLELREIARGAVAAGGNR